MVETSNVKGHDLQIHTQITGTSRKPTRQQAQVTNTLSSFWHKPFALPEQGETHFSEKSQVWVVLYQHRTRPPGASPQAGRMLAFPKPTQFAALHLGGFYVPAAFLKLSSFFSHPLHLFLAATRPHPGCKTLSRTAKSKGGENPSKPNAQAQRSGDPRHCCWHEPPRVGPSPQRCFAAGEGALGGWWLPPHRWPVPTVLPCHA